MPDLPSDESTSPDRAPEHRRGDRRKNVVDIRTPEERLRTGLERRRGPGRRRSDFIKSAEEGEMTPEQFLFIKAIDVYKRVNDRPFPTWTEVLEVVRKLGYRKTCAMTLEIDGAEDWSESPDAPVFTPRHEPGADQTAA